MSRASQGFHHFRTRLLWLQTNPHTSVLMSGFYWYQHQWSQCGFGSAKTGSLVKKRIWSLHHQICTSVIDMGIKWVLFLIWRCKDYYGSHPLSVSIYRVNPYFRITSPWPRTSPCTSTLMMGLEWYPFQCFRCQFGGVRTGSFSPH